MIFCLRDLVINYGVCVWGGGRGYKTGGGQVKFYPYKKGGQGGGGGHNAWP